MVAKRPVSCQMTDSWGNCKSSMDNYFEIMRFQKPICEIGILFLCLHSLKKFILGLSKYVSPEDVIGLTNT